FAPLPLIIYVRRYTGLLSEVRDDVDRHILGTCREAPLVLENFQQHGKTESGRPGLVTEQGALVRRERPMLGQFVWVPLRLHETLVSVGRVRHGSPSPDGAGSGPLVTVTVAPQDTYRSTSRTAQNEDTAQ